MPTTVLPLKPVHFPTDRVQRLKDARTEAAKDVEALKADKNKEFAGFEKQFSGTSDDTFARVNQETEQRLVEVRQAYEKNKELVIERLLAGITNVHPKPHPNAPKAKTAA
ncbi:H(+)-transporting V1 sector ATPase subunit G [Rhizophlyctis rosea]|nr:H(+)-transporting V1 sector ATPase subunit G [Rhizophlyctis rosea]